MNILFLCNRPTNNSQAETVAEYMDALKNFSEHKIFEISMLHNFPSRINLNNFDVVITHYTLSLGPLLNHYLGRQLIAKLKKYNGLKVAFLQDEYRSTQTYWKNLNDLGIDILFSCVPKSEISKVYPKNKVPKLKVENVLTGYISNKLLNYEVLPIKDRSIDVGYRTRKTPYWLGKLGYEKWFIAEEFKRKAKDMKLNIDFSTKEGDRLYGNDWVNFIASCRAVIGVESGASIIDYDGELEKSVESYVEENPDASFDQVFEKFLKPYEGNVYLNQISPRCFEAIALKTPMVLFEGEYSGILIPNLHYIPLKKDFSNFSYVCKMLRDFKSLEIMVDRAYKDIAINPAYSYKEFIKKVDNVINKEIKIRKTSRAVKTYTVSEFKWQIRISINYFFRRLFVNLMQNIFLGVPFMRNFTFAVWDKIPLRIQHIIRPLARIISR